MPKSSSLSHKLISGVYSEPELETLLNTLSAEGYSILHIDLSYLTPTKIRLTLLLSRPTKG